MKTVSSGVTEPGVRTFSKKELVDLVAERTGLKRSDAKIAINEFVDLMREALGAGHRIEFRNFGIFEVKLRRSRKAQNPRTLERVDVPPRRTVKFKVGADLKVRLEELDRAAERGLLNKNGTLGEAEMRVLATDPPKTRHRKTAGTEPGSAAVGARPPHSGA
ncbi:MAG: integration host factor subunit beta [Phycisphaerales bacterium]|nr:integration host factor subunit beta [Phycisphaerales bacterium]